MAPVLICSNNNARQPCGVILTNGYIYVFMVTDWDVPANGHGNIRVYKSTNAGQNWSNIATESSTTITGTANLIQDVAAAVDGNGQIHVAVFCTANQDACYAIYNPSTDTFGSWETIGVVGTWGFIAIDASNKPHIGMRGLVSSMGNGIGQYLYTNKTGSNWLASEQVTAETSGVGADECSILVHGNPFVVEAVWASINSPYAGYRTRSGGTWGTPTYMSGGAETSTHSAILFDGSSVYRYHNVSSGGDGYENTAAMGLDGPNMGYGNLFGVTFYQSLRAILYAATSTGPPTTYRLKVGQYTGSSWSCRNVLTGSNAYQYPFAFCSPTGYGHANTGGEFIYTIGAGPYYTYFATLGTNTSSNLHLYVKGRVLASTSLPAYLEGCDPYQKPSGDGDQSGTWKDQAEGTNLAASIDEYDPVDSDYAYIQSPQVGDYFEVDLAQMEADIDWDTGDCTIEWRPGRLSGDKSYTFRCTLINDTTPVRSDERTISGSFATYSAVLTAGEFNQVKNDYNALKLRFEVVGVS